MPILLISAKRITANPIVNLDYVSLHLGHLLSSNGKQDIQKDTTTSKLALCLFPYPPSADNPYLFENCGARRAALRPYFLRSFIRGSRVKNPAFLRTGLYSASACNKALEIP